MKLLLKEQHEQLIDLGQFAAIAPPPAGTAPRAPVDLGVCRPS